MTVYTLFLYIGMAAIVLTVILGFGHSKIKEYPITNPIVWLIQYFVGSLLIFSGLVKAVDPLGTAYKMKDYFTEFDTQGFPLMDFMGDNAVAFSVFMLVLELVLGVCLILGIGQRKTTWTTLAMMLFFTFLTGFNYLTGYTSKVDGVTFLEFGKWGTFSDENIRITDCGCFGDFLKLKPIETFIKDIIFTLLSFYLVISTRKLKELIPLQEEVAVFKNKRVILGTIFTAVALWFCLQNFYFDIPMVDFRPFAEGMDLRKAKEDCAAHTAKVETVFVYKNKKTEEEKTINGTDMANHGYMWTEKDADGNLVWENQKEKMTRVVLDPGCSSQIQYFEKDEVLEEKGYNFLVLGVDLDKADKAAFLQIGKNAALAEKDGNIKTRCMYNYIGKQSIDDFRQDVQGAYEFATADEKLIKTIIRANPGLLLIKDGKVIKKWHHKHIPDYATIKQNYMN